MTFICQFRTLILYERVVERNDFIDFCNSIYSSYQKWQQHDTFA